MASNFIDIKFSGFIDRKGVREKFSRAMFRPLVKAAALTRTIAKRSIRQRKAASPPGKPPSSHTGLLKQFIFFAADQRREDVVIGPMRLNGTASRRQKPLPTELLEFGGTTRDDNGRPRRYKARPYMGPAMDKAVEKFPGLFKG